MLLFWNMYFLDYAERPQPDNFLSFMLHELAFSHSSLGIRNRLLRVGTVVKFYNHTLPQWYGYISMQYYPLPVLLE